MHGKKCLSFMCDSSLKDFTQDLLFSSIRVSHWKCHLTECVMDNKKAGSEAARKLGGESKERDCEVLLMTGLLMSSKWSGHHNSVSVHSLPG